jgi:nucleotide-binding universal stress UspA family protein
LACTLADALNAKLLIVHAGRSNEVRPNPSSRFDANVELSRFMPKDVEVDYDYLVQAGDPATVIRNVESSRHVDLIVLGTHGRKGMERLFAGSVAEKVIRAATCPVVTLRQRKLVHLPASDGRAMRILVPTDFSAQSHPAIAFASSIAGPLNAKLTILHVVDEATVQDRAAASRSAKPADRTPEPLEQLKHVTPAQSKVEFEHLVLRGDPSKRIAEFADERRYDFVVVGTHGRSGLGRALIGSVAEQIVRNCRSPVICVKLNNKRPPTFEPRTTRKPRSAAKTVVHPNRGAK